jgi:hypothetical protein
MWCWRRMEKSSWTDRVRNEVLHWFRGENNIQHATRWRQANWIDHILRRNFLIKHAIEGKLERWVEVKGRREWRRKQLKD